jgi:hypothetical protein
LTQKLLTAIAIDNPVGAKASWSLLVASGWISRPPTHKKLPFGPISEGKRLGHKPLQHAEVLARSSGFEEIEPHTSAAFVANVSFPARKTKQTVVRRLACTATAPCLLAGALAILSIVVMPH